MANQMSARHIDCAEYAPIWAWHSCTHYEQAPTLLVARCLLSDIELENGIQTIEFECPAELAILSTYGTWNVLLHDFFATSQEGKIDKKIEQQLFATERNQFSKYDSIQATLPYIKLEWVQEIRELKLKPNDYRYSPKARV
ncbi:hypothetical protein GCM10027592_51580 [Spirosoma flavus]